MWIQFLRHKRIAAKGSTRGQGEEGKAFEKNPFAQIGWPPLASAIAMSLAIKKFCTVKKKEETKKGFATSGWCKCAAVSRKFFSSVRNTKRLCVKKITRALSIVSSRLWKLEIQFIRIENRRCMNRPKKRVKYVFIIFFYLYARVLHFESTSNTKFLEKVSFFKKK